MHAGLIACRHDSVQACLLAGVPVCKRACVLEFVSACVEAWFRVFMIECMRAGVFRAGVLLCRLGCEQACKRAGFLAFSRA
jgi:hypothetical protein